MTAETDLLPCPWCGGEAVDTQAIGGGYYYATCRKASCGIGPDAATSAEAIAAWNTRANLAELQREVEGLRLAKDAANRMLLAELSRNERLETSNERLAGALREAREYVVSELAGERAKFAGYEHCSTIASIEADIAKIDAALDQETTNG